MSVFGSLRSKMSGQTQEQFGSGQRFPLTKDLMRAIREHMNDFYGVDLTSYKFERRNSDYPQSKSDLVIYDENNNVILHGRESNDGRVAVWR